MIRQGICTFDESLKIDAGYSPFLSEILYDSEKDLEGIDILEGLFAHSDLSVDCLSQVKEVLHLVFERTNYLGR